MKPFRLSITVATGSLLCLLLVPVRGESRPAPEKNGATGPAELAAHIPAIMKETGLPGACVVLVNRDQIAWTGCFGTTGRVAGEPVTPATRFEMASITKTFVSLTILKLAGEGRLDLNRPVREILPDLVMDNPWEKECPVRVIHLLEHTAGFDAAHFYEYYNLRDDPDLPLASVLARNPYSRTVRWKPGTRTGYTNHGLAVAGLVLETVTGRRFEEYIEREILIPLGMTDSGFKTVSGSGPRPAQGHLAGGEPIPPPVFYLRPASSLKSTGADMARFVRFLLNRGRTADGRALLSEAAVARAETTLTTSAARAGFSAGYGLNIKMQFQSGFRYYSFTGGIPGFTTLYMYLPKADRGAVILTNSSDTDAFSRIFRETFRCLVRDLTPPQAPPPQATPPQATPPAGGPALGQEYAGYYRYRNPDEQLSAMFYFLFSGRRIGYEEGRWQLQDFLSDPENLIPAGNGCFRRDGEPAASLCFFRNEEGNLCLADMSAYYERSSPLPPMLWRIILSAAGIILLSQLPFAIGWIPVALWRKFRRQPAGGIAVAVRLISLTAIVLLLGGIYLMMPRTAEETIHFGQMNFSSLAFFFGTIGFATGSAVTAWVWWLIRRRLTRPEWIYYLLVSAAGIMLTAWTGYWGLLGLRLWDY